MKSRVLYAGDGQTSDYPIPFPYISRTHVRVFVNKVEQTTPGDYEFHTSSMIRLRIKPRPNDAVEIIRQTESDDLLVRFQNGSVLTDEELNLATLQTLYLTQELRDYFNAVLTPGVNRIASAAGVVGATAGEVIDAVTQEILRSELLASLQQRIADIELNAISIQAQAIRTDGLDGRVDNLQGLVDALGGVNGDIGTFLLNEQEQRIQGDQALVSSLALIGARSGDGQAWIANLDTLRVSPTESLGTRLAALRASTDANTATIAAEQTARTTADSALTQSLTTLTARVGTAEGAIAAEQTARANATSALAQSLTALTARVDTAEGAIATEQTARANADSALTTQINTATSRIGAAESQIAGLSTTVANNNSAQTTRIDQAFSRIGTAEGLIQSIQTTTANADSALASRLDGLQAEVDTARATIVTEQTTRANEVSSLAESITTLQSALNGNTTSIQTLQTVTDGIRGQYGVRIDANGYVAGFGLLNGGPGSSQFIVLADKFALVTPGSNPVVPFIADANGVYMPNAFIRNLSVDRITGGAIGSQWNLAPGGGRIVLDTGSHMKVIGVGFGANSDLIEWYGPKMAITACTKANAITYVGTDGSAYFGGTLRAGTVFTAGRLNVSVQSLFPSAALTFDQTHSGSLGRVRTIVASFDLTFEAGGGYATSNEAFNFLASIPELTGTVELGLFRGSTLLSSWTVTSGTAKEGPEYLDVEPPQWVARAFQSFSGSRTVTDTSGGTGDIPYSLRVISASGSFQAYFNGFLSLSITEE